MVARKHMYRHMDLAPRFSPTWIPSTTTAKTAPGTTVTPNTPPPAAPTTSHGTTTTPIPPAASPNTSTSVSVSSESKATTTPVASVISVQSASVAEVTLNTANSVIRSQAHTTAHTTSSVTIPTPTQTATDDGSVTNVAGIAGGIVGGILVLTCITVFFLRRRFTKRRDAGDEFNRDNAIRQSVMIPDDGHSVRSEPRPPSMIERHYNASPAVTYGYNVQPSYQPGQYMPPTSYSGPGGAPASPLPQVPQEYYVDNYQQPMGYSEHPYASAVPVRSPTSPTHRQPGSPGGYPQPGSPGGYPQPGSSGGYPQPPTPTQRQPSTPTQQHQHIPAPLSRQNSAGSSRSHHYNDVSRSFQEQQYAEIDRQLGTETPPASPSPFGDQNYVPHSPLRTEMATAAQPPHSPLRPEIAAAPLPPHLGLHATTYPEVRSTTPVQKGQIVTVHSDIHQGHETPVQFGFTDGPATPTHQQPHMAVPATRGVVHPAAKRPETVYDDDDAYGGI